MKSPGWLSRNTTRSFPLVEDGNVVALNTGWSLPDNVLTDAFIVTPSQSVYIASVTITKSIISFVLADPATGSSLASAVAVLGNNPSFSQVPLIPLVPGISGAISIGDIMELERFTELKKGCHYFDRGLVLESRAVMTTGLQPVALLGAFGSPGFSGSVAIEGGPDLAVVASEGVDDNDPLTFLTISLVNPARYLSPCEEPTNPCSCPKVPIRRLNTVEPDVNGNITIQIIGPNGQIIPLGLNGLALSILLTGKALCVVPAMPDSTGRLPFDQSPDPVTPYP